eukprot:scaffold248211_cov13-Tisochrysis_lutea.AAC.1
MQQQRTRMSNRMEELERVATASDPQQLAAQQIPAQGPGGRGSSSSGSSGGNGDVSGSEDDVGQ